MAETKTIVLATATGVFLAFVILWVFFRLHLQGTWESSGSARRRVVALSLVLYALFLTTLFPLFALKLKTGQSFREIVLITLAFNGFAAVLVVEGLQAVLGPVLWPMAKQVAAGVLGWLAVSALMALIASRVILPWSG